MTVVTKIIMIILNTFGSAAQDISVNYCVIIFKVVIAVGTCVLLTVM